MKEESTWLGFTYSLGPIKLKWRIDDGAALFVTEDSGRSLWMGAQILCDWKSRKYCKSLIGGLSTAKIKDKN